VKHWHETAEILERVKNLLGAGVRAAIATVVRISGSAYRRVERAGAGALLILGGVLISELLGQVEKRDDELVRAETSASSDG